MRGTRRTPQHFVRKPRETPALFREAFGVRTRLRVALAYGRYTSIYSQLQ